MSASKRWAEALSSWAIPPEILEQAPVSPWVHPPAMFVVADDAAEAPITPSMTVARDAHGTGGTMLDVGCGGGGSSVPLGSVMTELTGVDEQQAMLDNFAAACGRRGITHREIRGRWPDVAAVVEAHDVVVCHHVVYNVADIEPFVQALTSHARRRVVVELPLTHPTSPFNPLWEYFWALKRPSEPTAALFVDVVRETGLEPTVLMQERPPRNSSMPGPDYIAFVRTRLCLAADRDEEIARELDRLGPLGVHTVACVTWEPPR